MRTMPHLSQIQSTDLEKHPHLLDELLELLEKVNKLEGYSVKGVFATYADMVVGAKEVGFYNVIVDETFKNHATGYYFDGKEFHIKYGLKSILDRIDKIQDITDDAEDLILPHIDDEKVKSVIVEPGQTTVEIPLDGNDYTYEGGITADGVVVKDINIIDNKLVIDIEKAPASTEVKIIIPEGSIKTKTGKGNKPTEVDIITNGEKPIIEQNSVNGNMYLELVGEQEFRFKVNYSVTPISKNIDLDLVHVNQQGLIRKTYDEDTDEIVIKLDLIKGREYKIIFYEGVISSDRTLSDYLECMFKVKEAPEIPEEPSGVEWEYTFTLPNATAIYNFNKDAKFMDDIPDDVEIYSDKYMLYYLGYQGEGNPIVVPRTGFDTFSANNPDGGYSYMSGVMYFETATVGDKVYKLVRLGGEVDG